MTLLIQKNRKQCWPVDQWEDRMLSIQIIGYHLLTDHCRHPNASISFHGPINLSSSLLTDGLHGSRSLLASDWSSLSIPASDWLTGWLFSVKVSSLISRSNYLVNITRKWQHFGSRTDRRTPETIDLVLVAGSLLWINNQWSLVLRTVYTLKLLNITTDTQSEEKPVVRDSTVSGPNIFWLCNWRSLIVNGIIWQANCKMRVF